MRRFIIGNILTCESGFLRLLDKYLYKELWLTFLAVLAVLLLITFGTETARLLAMAVEGSLPASVVFEVLLLKIPPALEIILPLVALLAVMLVVGRLYQDQEMVVMQTCGIAPRYFQHRVAWFLVPIVLMTLALTLWLTPWTFAQERHLIAKAQVSAPLAGLVAGRFNSLPSSNGVMYVKNIDGQGRLSEVWIEFQQGQSDVMLSAPRGHFEQVNGRLALILLEGYSYEGVLQGEAIVHRRFERFEAYLPDLTPVQRSPQRWETSTFALWQSEDPADWALLQWRFVVPLSVLVLGLLALKLSKTGPREGRFAKVFIAIVLYVVFNQLVMTSREAVSHGSLSPWIGLWWVPLLFLVYALLPDTFGWRRYLRGER